MVRPVLFLDRDGTLNADTGYPHRVDELSVIADLEVLRLFQRHEYELVIVTNQSGIGRGLFSKGEFWRFTDALLGHLSAARIRIDGVLMCPHHPEHSCECRKPSAGLIRDSIYAGRPSVFIGDSEVDAQCAQQVGAKFFFAWPPAKQVHEYLESSVKC